VIVVDASAVLDGLLDAPSHPGIAVALSGARQPLAAPDLLDVEVLSVLRRWEQRGEITTARARVALDDLDALPVVRHSARALTDIAWSMRKTLTAYDAQYVTLAKILPGTLLTTDQRMASAARQLRVAVA
jgi:predicted nucleic acid-binding protein